MAPAFVCISMGMEEYILCTAYGHSDLDVIVWNKVKVEEGPERE